jgi:hypothetical protein
VPSVFVLLLLSKDSRLGPSIGSIQMACMSNSSAVDFVHDSFGTWASPVSLLFLGLPLFRGIGCWGDVVANVFISSAVLPISVW